VRRTTIDTSERTVAPGPQLGPRPLTADVEHERIVFAERVRLEVKWQALLELPKRRVPGGSSDHQQCFAVRVVVLGGREVPQRHGRKELSQPGSHVDEAVEVGELRVSKVVAVCRVGEVRPLIRGDLRADDVDARPTTRAFGS
jgi:hypothetical protein